MKSPVPALQTESRTTVCLYFMSHRGQIHGAFERKEFHNRAGLTNALSRHKAFDPSLAREIGCESQIVPQAIFGTEFPHPPDHRPGISEAPAYGTFWIYPGTVSNHPRTEAGLIDYYDALWRYLDAIGREGRVRRVAYPMSLVKSNAKDPERARLVEAAWIEAYTRNASRIDFQRALIPPES